MQTYARWLLRAFFLLLAVTACFFFLKMCSYSNKKSNEDAQYFSNFKSSFKLFGETVPKDIYFAGEQIPLSDSLIAEYFKIEILANSYYLSHAALLKKKNRPFFQIIEPILKKNGIPDDFKYVPLMESNFSDTINYKGARGFWQMMPVMASGFGLLVNDTIDERSDVKKSTEVVCRYLNQSHEKFGTWIYALASLNYGTTGLENILNTNKSQIFVLNKETTDYLFRLLFFKEIFERGQLYGAQR